MPNERPYIEPISSYWITFDQDIEVSETDVIEAIDQAKSEPDREATDV